MSGIGGEVFVARYVFRLGLRAGTRLHIFDEVEGIGLKPTATFDILLGMDILRHCELEMQPDGAVALTARD